MFSTVPQVTLFLLQGQTLGYFKEDNPEEVKVVLIAIAVLIAVVFIGKRLRGSNPGVSFAGKARSGGKAQVTPRKFSIFTLYRIASNYGLNSEQRRLLGFVFRNDSVADPKRVMGNAALLDRHFKRAYRIIEKSSDTDEAAQERMANLFALRNIIEAGGKTDNSSPPRLAENTQAVLIMGKDNYKVKVLASRARTLVIAPPLNALGTPLHIGKGTSVTLSFFTQASKGFSLSGQVAGALSTEHGEGVQISHTGKVKPLIKRMYRRKQTSIHCDFSLVNFNTSGGKKNSSKMTVDSRRFTGTILDISVGGCAVKSRVPVGAGSYLKITMDYGEGYLIHVLGQVLRTNRSGAAGTILHTKFLKVPRRAYNSISALVFEYDQ